MHIILIYDIKDSNRLNKVRNICKKYLHWIQNSVFQGDITESNLAKLEMEIIKVISKDEGDSVIRFKFFGESTFEKRIIGVERNRPENEIW